MNVAPTRTNRTLRSFIDNRIVASPTVDSTLSDDALRDLNADAIALLEARRKNDPASLTHAMTDTELRDVLRQVCEELDSRRSPSEPTGGEWTYGFQMRPSRKGGTAGSSPSPRDQCGVGLTAGPLGSFGHRPTGNTSGTGACWCRVCLPDQSAGSDHTNRSSDGRPARYIRRVQTRDPKETNPGWSGPCAGKRETAGSAGNRGRTRRGNPETASCRC